ncbi:MAG: penicillin-binding protein 2 [Ardenticatenales bacterium]|nr:penicillin-binding protein 2 [Ardenticatenales bacterium]
MNRRTFLKLVPAGTLAALLSACGQGANQALPSPEPASTPEATSPEFVVRRFLDAWHAGDFDTMYSVLTPEAQAAISREDFEVRYRGVLAEATIYDVVTTLVAAGRLSEREGAAEFDVLYRTRLVGDLQFRPRINTQLGDDGNWRIAWTPAVLIPALGEQNRLRLFARTSTRGIIYDRNGEILATQGAIVTLGIIPGEIQDEGAVQGLISELSGMPPGEIAEKYAGQPAEWFIPIADIPFERSQANYERLISTPGISLRERAVRAYPQGESAAHIIGFVGKVNADELTALGERGYEETDFVGKQGIEAWGEEILAGKKGGRLAILSPEGNEVETLADVPAVQSRSLHLTLDAKLQRAAEAALERRKGSVVAVDVATGQVLAMASWPAFDPNIMADEQANEQRAALASSPEQPLVNRATQGAYPSGSLFKVITMAAGMEKAGLPRTDPHFCPGVWTGFGFPMRCWKSSGHGNIDLFHGLEQSCNVVFFETGVKLYEAGNTALQDMAAQFGVGAPTGVEVDETPGLLPTPEWKQTVMNDTWVPGDTVNLSIGQGFLQTTPAQMARMALTVATGGVVRELTLVREATDPTGVAQPEQFQKGEPPRITLRAETLSAVQGAMRAVAVPPLGTASGVFGNFPIPIAGKTGTAETTPGQPTHAWFTGYAPFDQPQIAFLGMLEFGGEGSGAAAPMIRKVLEQYFGVVG